MTSAPCLWPIHHASLAEAEVAWLARTEADRTAVAPGICADCDRPTVRPTDRLKEGSCSAPSRRLRSWQRRSWLRQRSLSA
jgi:hypothetical protein